MSGSGLRTTTQAVLESYLLLATGVGLGVVAWAGHVSWEGVITTSQPDPFAAFASVFLAITGLTLWVPHGIALRGCRKRWAARGLGTAGWGSTPTDVLTAVAVGAAVLVLLALLEGLPTVAWLVPVGLLAVEAFVVLVRELDERWADVA